MKKTILICMTLAISFSGCAVQNQNMITKTNKVEIKSTKLFDSSKWIPINNGEDKLSKVVN